jgi:KTSC domain-containing protein
MPSTVIRRIDYDAPSRTLRVTFVSGDLYAYFDVPPEAYDAFRSAFSKGQHFAAHVRDRYAYELERRAADAPWQAG